MSTSDDLFSWINDFYSSWIRRGIYSFIMWVVEIIIISIQYFIICRGYAPSSRNDANNCCWHLSHVKSTSSHPPSNSPSYPSTPSSMRCKSTTPTPTSYSHFGNINICNRIKDHNISTTSPYLSIHEIMTYETQCIA